MSNLSNDKPDLFTEPPPSLIFDMVADITILQAIVAGLGRTDERTLALIRAALAQLAIKSVQVGQHTPLVKLMDETMQRRIATFEAKLPRLPLD